MSSEKMALSWPKEEAVNLEETLKELEEWRSHKKGLGERIPELLYMKIVILSKRYSSGRICALFSISGKQLKGKTKHFEKLGYLKPTQTSESVGIDFHEVKNKPPTLKKEVMQLVQDTNDNVLFPKEVRHPKLKLDRTTMVVELFNGNKKMAIHITQESLPELMDAFFSRSV